MNQTSLKYGVEAVKDDAYFKEMTGKIIRTREHAKEVLGEMGFTFPDSKANFLFITHPEYSAKELFEALKQEDIYVRYFSLPRIDNYLRVTIGTDEQMEVLYDFLRRYMNR
jgi:histidinol-phosphate aminotransferase